MNTCPICVEPYNKTTRLTVSCNYCEYSACRTCCESYILQQVDAKCMSCSKIWTREDITRKFTKKWISTKYKQHRERCLFELEKAMLPATQPIVEQENENIRIRTEIMMLRTQIDALQRTIREHEQRLRGGTVQTERKVFIRKCPNPQCRGFLSSQWKCNLCDKKTCKECNECILDEGDDEHKCDPNNVETAKLLAKDTKPCPKCGEMIFKIDGCFAKDTPILMWDGTVKLSQDIRVGDILVGDDDTPRNVLQLCSGEDELFRVEQEHGIEYTVNSKHTLVLLSALVLDEIHEIKVEDYLALPPEQVDSFFGWKSDDGRYPVTNIKVTPVGKGRYYGWMVDQNHRFLLKDTTVVRNCDQMYCVQCHTAFSWRTGRIETGVVHNPHYFEWLRMNNRNAEGGEMVIQCGREIDHHFVRTVRNTFATNAICLCRNVLHFRQVELRRYQTNPFLDNQDLRVMFLRNRITEEDFRITLQKREKAHQKKGDMYNLFVMMIQCITEIIYRYHHSDRRGIGGFEQYFDEVLNLLEYVNSCLRNISITYNCQRYIVTSQLNVIACRQ